MAWQMREAKAGFSRLVQQAVDEGPQTVTRYGRPAVVIMSIGEYRRLRSGEPSLKNVLMSGPDGGLELPDRILQEREIDW